MEKHQQNIELYISSGGDPKLIKIYKAPTIENRAKLKYLLSKLKSPEDKNDNLSKKISEKPRQSLDTNGQQVKPKFLGFITQYPAELHFSYQEAFSLWLQLCSLKIRLNAIAPEKESPAYEIQTDMLRKIQNFDRYKKALDHYTHHKAIIPTESKRDFSKLTELELDKTRRNLASNICKRKQTITKKESELPDPASPLYQRRLEALNRKIEELEELILDEEKISEMLKGKSFL